jgi:5-methylcytosine-specific restriction endonuclease McrA
MTLVVRALDGSIVSKECSKCGCFLSPQAFTKAKWLDIGLRSDCKECRKKASKNINFRALARELGHARYPGKPCKKCGKSERFTGNGGCVHCKYEQNRNSPATKQYRKVYYREHYDKVVANVKSRKLAKIQRVPPWLTSEHKQQIASVYRQAQILTQETGVQMHVDHIVPLKGKIVSGLHVPWNLQILSKEENLAKNNKWKSAQ